MNLLRRALLVAGVGGLATAAGYFAHRWRRTGATLQGAGGDILRGRYVDLDGRPRTLESLAGRILVINYWATWCEPCRKEIPVFVRLQQEYAAKNVQFVGIAIDQADKIREFAKEFGINYPLFIAGVEALEAARRAGNKAGVLPYTLVLDPSVTVVVNLVGELSEDRIRAALLPLLEQG